MSFHADMIQSSPSTANCHKIFKLKARADRMAYIEMTPIGKAKMLLCKLQYSRIQFNSFHIKIQMLCQKQRQASATHANDQGLGRAGCVAAILP